jgi:hypothetical protein
LTFHGWPVYTINIHILFEFRYNTLNLINNLIMVKKTDLETNSGALNARKYPR